MDFNLDEPPENARSLTAQILDAEIGPPGIMADPPAHRRAGWALAKSGLVEAFLPEPAGGAGLDAMAMTAVIREVALRTAAVPLPAVLSTGIFPLVRFGGEEHEPLLERVAAGGELMVGAVREPGRMRASRAQSRAAPVAGGFELSGVKTMVPFASDADWILVPAQYAREGVGLFLLPAGAPGVTVTPHPTGCYLPAGTVTLDRVKVAAGSRLGACDGTAAAYLDLCASLGVAAYASGLMAGALAITAKHVKTREQFGRVLAQFQAVSHQAADAFMADMVLSTLAWAGSYQLAVGGLEEAARLLGAADLALVSQMMPALLACQHVHGGLGLDATYPIHRYVTAGMHLSQVIGGTDVVAENLGDLVSASDEGDV